MGSPKTLVGYDYSFISETPDYIMCSICHLVLRDPIMIITCGHKFCAPCFERMKVYYTDRKLLFCCPVDRDAIDYTKVCEDAGLRRAIANLKVKCCQHGNGCSWQGDLSEMEAHQSSCQHNQSGGGSSATLQGHQKVTDERLDEMRKHVNQCEAEIDELKRANASLETEIVRLNQLSEKQRADIEEERIHNSIQIEMTKKETRLLQEALASKGIIRMNPPEYQRQILPNRKIIPAPRRPGVSKDVLGGSPEFVSNPTQSLSQVNAGGPIKTTLSQITGDTTDPVLREIWNTAFTDIISSQDNAGGSTQARKRAQKPRTGTQKTKKPKASPLTE